MVARDVMINMLKMKSSEHGRHGVILDGLISDHIVTIVSDGI